MDDLLFDDTEEIPPLDLYVSMLRATRGVSAVHAYLADDLERRGQNLFALMTGHVLALPAFAQAHRMFEALAGISTVEAVTTLIERSCDDALRALTALIAGDEPSCNDICRDLMEVEALIRDFTRDSSQIAKWAGNNDLGHDEGFGFGKILDRLRAAEGVDQGLTLPQMREYQVHSIRLHPSAKTPKFSTENRVDSLTYQLADVIEHLDRVIWAVGFLMNTHEDLRSYHVEPEKPDPRTLDMSAFVALRDSLRAFLAREIRQSGIHLDRQPYNKHERGFPGLPPSSG